MKRKERRQLKENELATGLSRFVKWIKKHEKKFRAAAVGLVALLVVLVAVRLLLNYQKGQEARYLSEVLALKADLKQKPENLAKLEELSQKKRYERMASLALACYYLEKNDLDRAEQILARVKDTGRDLVHYQILDLYGQIQIKRGNYDQAIEIYRQVEKEKPDDYPLDVVLFRLAEACEKKGDREQALNVYRDLQANYQNTYYGYQASLKLVSLEAAR
jgi:predicted negative regulator of RcsB-dependent stress response